MMLIAVFFAVLLAYAVFVLCSELFKQSISLKYRHVFITGGSSGIGLALAKEAWREGAFVTIVARNEARLKAEVEKIRHLKAPEGAWIRYLVMDVTSGFETIQKTISDYINTHDLPIDVLVNCAGSAIAKEFTSAHHSEFRHQIELNYLSSVDVTKAALPSLLRPSKGPKRLAFVCSQAGQVAIYGFTAYSASKFALRGFAEALGMELVNTAVKAENVGKPEITKLLSSASGLVEPETVAAKLLQDIKSGNAVSTCGMEGCLLSLATAGLTPSRIAASMPWLGPILAPIVECLLATPIRLIAMVTAWRFQQTIRQQ